MNNQDTFWHIESVERIETARDFYAQLENVCRLADVRYVPGELGPEQDGVRKVRNIIFERVIFSHTLIKSVIFRNCKFVGCHFIGATFDNCEISRCEFVNTNTHKIVIKNSYIDPNQFGDCLDRKRHQNLGVHLYQMLLRNSKSTDQVEFERDAHFLFLRWKRHEDFYLLKRELSGKISGATIVNAIMHFLAYLRRLLWEETVGSGIRIRYYLRTTMAVLVIATTINYFCSRHLGLEHDGVPISTWSQAFYFTVISCTTVGYGDITPVSALGRIWVSVQGMVGVVLFALLASMLFRRITP